MYTATESYRIRRTIGSKDIEAPPQPCAESPSTKSGPWPNSLHNSSPVHNALALACNDVTFRYDSENANNTLPVEFLKTPPSRLTVCRKRSIKIQFKCCHRRTSPNNVPCLDREGDRSETMNHLGLTTCQATTLEDRKVYNK
mgnify:CR=1 FL=1